MMTHFLKIIYKPTDVFDEIKKQHGEWGFSLCIVVLISILLSVLMLPIGEHLLAAISRDFSMNQAEMIKSAAQQMKYVGIVVSAVIFIFKIFLLALVVYGLIHLCNGHTRYSQVISLLIYVTFILLLGQLMNCAIVYGRGLENLTSQYDIYKTGLNVFFDSKLINGLLYTILTHINLFEIWAIVLLVVGVSQIADVNTTEAIIVAFSYWIILILLDVFPILLASAHVG